MQTLQSHLILTMSHWSSGLTCLLPASRVTGSNPLGVLMWNRESPVSVVSLQSFWQDVAENIFAGHLFVMRNIFYRLEPTSQDAVQPMYVRTNDAEEPGIFAIKKRIQSSILPNQTLTHYYKNFHCTVGPTYLRQSRKPEVFPARNCTKTCVLGGKFSKLNLVRSGPRTATRRGLTSWWTVPVILLLSSR